MNRLKQSLPTEVTLGSLLTPASSEPFTKDTWVRVIDHIPEKLQYPYLKTDTTDYPFGSVTSEHYNRYRLPLLLSDPVAPTKFILCQDRGYIYVSKKLNAYKYRMASLELCMLLFQLHNMDVFDLKSDHDSHLLELLKIHCPLEEEKKSFLEKHGCLESLDMQSLPQGYILCNGKYVIREKLGTGYFGITYLAETNAPGTSEHGRLVVIKELYMSRCCCRQPETGWVNYTNDFADFRFVKIARLKFEGEITKNRLCNNPHIVRIDGSFEENNTLYYTMEYIQGKSLEDLMIDGYRFTEEEVVRYVREVAEALKEMHANRLLHLDIKPANILLSDTGKTVLIDFGATKQYDGYGFACSGNPLISTVAFESPEVRRGKMDVFLPQADVYSLGMTFYYLLMRSFPRNRHELNRNLKQFSPTTNYAIRCAIHYDSAVRLMNIDDFLAVLDGRVVPKCLLDSDNEIIRTKSRKKESGFF